MRSFYLHVPHVDLLRRLLRQRRRQSSRAPFDRLLRHTQRNAGSCAREQRNWNPVLFLKLRVGQHGQLQMCGVCGMLGKHCRNTVCMLTLMRRSPATSRRKQGAWGISRGSQTP